MRIWSHSWANGERIPARCAASRLDAARRAVASDNRNPHLAWDEVPERTLSFALIAHDFDGPMQLEQAAAGASALSALSTAELAAPELSDELPRMDFFHWLLVDLPAERRQIDEGEYSQGLLLGGKPGPLSPDGTRQGLNDFSRLWASDAARAGDYFGYDGPWPPPGDALVHHYVFTLYALDVARAPIEGRFGGHELRRAIYPHVLAEATLSGTYSLNPRHQRSD
jgi:Raf kinase inhibitor-like YbhB/YbcL family protein